MTLTEFYQQESRRLRHQFGRGVRDVESIAKGKFRPVSAPHVRRRECRLSDHKPVVQLRRSVRLLTASQYLEQGHHVLFTVSGIDGLLEEAGDEIGNLRVDVGVNALLLDTL